MDSGDLGATGRASTPLILENTRDAPRSEQVFGEPASRKWLIAYKAYCFYVDESNQTGVMHWERMTPGQLIPMHVTLVFVRKYAGERILESTQLMQAFEKHAALVFNCEEPSRRVADEVAKLATMQQGGELAKSRNEALTSAALRRSADESYKPDMAEYTTLAGCFPSGYQNLVNRKVKHLAKLKEDPERVLLIMTRASEERERVKIKL